MLTCEQGGTSSSEFAVKQNAQETWTNKTKTKISHLMDEGFESDFH